MSKQLIVISNPTAVSNEIHWIRKLFSQGLMCFHLRKPQMSIQENVQMLEQIGREHHSKIVLHQHFELAQIFNIKSIHCNQTRRNQLDVMDHSAFQLSTSIHSVGEFNGLDPLFKTAFLSPIFPSISKTGYRVDTPWNEALTGRTNFTTQLIALGGIDPFNLPQILAMPFDGFALLGSIWIENRGFKNFKLCQQIAQSF